jgi:hypothetical protein
MKSVLQINKNKTKILISKGVFQKKFLVSVFDTESINEPKKLNAQFKNACFVSSAFNSVHALFSTDTVNNSGLKKSMANKYSLGNFIKGRSMIDSDFNASFIKEKKCVLLSLPDSRYFKSDNQNIISGPLSVLAMRSRIFKNFPETGLIVINSGSSTIMVYINKGIFKEFIVLPGIDNSIDLNLFLKVFNNDHQISINAGDNKTLLFTYALSPELIINKEISNLFGQPQKLELLDSFLNSFKPFFKYPVLQGKSEFPDIISLESMAAALLYDQADKNTFVKKNVKKRFTFSKAALVFILLIFIFLSGFKYNSAALKNEEINYINTIIEKKFSSLLSKTPMVDPVYQLELFYKRLSEKNETAINSGRADQAVKILSSAPEGITFSQMHLDKLISVNGSFTRFEALDEFKNSIDNIFLCNSKIEWVKKNNANRFIISFEDNRKEALNE